MTLDIIFSVAFGEFNNVSKVVLLFILCRVQYNVRYLEKEPNFEYMKKEHYDQGHLVLQISMHLDDFVHCYHNIIK